MENTEIQTNDSNINHAKFKESTGTGVIGSLIFMGIMLLLMIVLSTIMH